MKLVYLHAFPLDHRMWDGQLDIYPENTETPNLYEHGESLEEWARSILSLYDPKEPLLLIGSSMGGSCALEMARQSRDRVAGMVLVGAKAGHRPEPLLRDRYIDTLKNSGIDGHWPDVLFQLFSPSPSQEIVEHLKCIADDQSTSDLIKAVRVFHGREDLSDVFSNWKKPLMVVCGTEGNLESSKRGYALADTNPIAQIHVMEGCGHYMNVERPSEFNEIIKKMISQCQ